MEMLLRQFLSTRVPAYQSTSVLVYQLSSLHFQSDQDQYRQASTGFHGRNPALLLQAWKQNNLEYLNQSTNVPSSKLPGSSTRDLLQPKSEGWFNLREFLKSIISAHTASKRYDRNATFLSIIQEFEDDCRTMAVIIIDTIEHMIEAT